MEARGGIEPPIKVLQTFALPLGDRATESGRNYLTSSGTCNSFLPANCFFCSEDPAEVTLSVPLHFSEAVRSPLTTLRQWAPAALDPVAVWPAAV